MIASLEEGRSPLLLTERRDHLEYFAPRLRKFARHLVVLHGSMNARGRSAAQDQLAAATIDAYGESEQVVGLYTMIEHLGVPFETTLLGVPVTVTRVDVTERDEIVAICSRGRLRQSIPILDLVLPSPAPTGADWIEAYRLCAGGA